MPRGTRAGGRANPRTFTFNGPWLGMEERENFQQPEHCQLALNVDFHRGYIEGRSGFQQISNKGADRMHLHTVKVNGVPRYLLGVGVNNAGAVVYYVYDARTGENVKTSTAIANEPIDKEFTCRFSDVIIAKDTDGDGVKESPHHVTLIYTKHNIYVFDPHINTLTIEEASMTGDVIAINDTSWGYWITPPRGKGPFGPIMTEHLGSIWYAGFPEHFNVELSYPVHNLQGQVPEANINQNNRSKMIFGPQHIAWSDPFDPLGIVAYHFLAVEEQEVITGIRSFKEQMVVFTDRSIYLLTGATDETFRLFKAVSGVGCVAPNSIVEANGVLYFMARDGIYGFTGATEGGAGLEKMTKGIDSIFTGNSTQTHVPDTAAPSVAHELSFLGWPYKAVRASMAHSNALHIQKKNQIWWSLDIHQTKPGSHALTLVYDYYHGAWSLYQPLQAGRGPEYAVSTSSWSQRRVSCMFDGTTVLIGGDEVIYTSGTGESGAGEFPLLRYGGRLDNFAQSNGAAINKSYIPFIYITGRLFKDNPNTSLFRPIRLKMLSWGSLAADKYGPRWFAEGEEAHADSQTLSANGTTVVAASETQGTSGLIPMHPTDGGNKVELFYGTAYNSGGAAHTPASTYQSRDWFTSKLEPASVRSRSLRIGFQSGYRVNVAGTYATDVVDRITGPPLVVQAIMVDVEGGDTR